MSGEEEEEKVNPSLEEGEEQVITSTTQIIEEGERENDESEEEDLKLKPGKTAARLVKHFIYSQAFNFNFIFIKF